MLPLGFLEKYPVLLRTKLSTPKLLLPPTESQQECDSVSKDIPLENMRLDDQSPLKEEVQQNLLMRKLERERN